MHNLKAVFTDLDNTLIHDTNVRPQLIENVSAYLNLTTDVSAQLIRDFFATQPQQTHYINGYSKSGVWKEVLKKYLHDIHPSTVIGLNEVFWGTIAEAVEAYEGVIDALKEIKKQGLTIVVVSGGDYISRYLQLKQTGLLDYIDDLVTTEELGVFKSHYNLYLKAAQDTDPAPSECIVIGDNEIDDVVLPKKDGFLTVKIDPELGTSEADYTVRDFPEILNLIKHV